jgi:hypothetical protein
MGIDLCYPSKQSLEEHCLNVKLMAMTSVTLGSRSVDEHCQNVR